MNGCSSFGSIGLISIILAMYCSTSMELSKMKVSLIWWNMVVLGLFASATACSDSPTALRLDAGDPLLNKNATAPAEQVLVGGNALITLGAGEPQPILVAAGETLHPQGLGSCLVSGAWINSAGNQTGAVPHEHCISGWTSGSITLQVTFAGEPAVWSNPGKNQNLNFQLLDETFGHFNYAQNRTSGQGVLAGSDNQGGLWFTNLAQLSGAGNTLARSGTVVQACNVDHGCHPISLCG
jgi:hypothetical protein